MTTIAKAPNCAHCIQPAELVTGSEVYPKRGDLAAKRFWMCRGCKAWVGVHENSPSFTPLGSPANDALRQMRSRCHKALDPLWQRGAMTRQQAYAWLAKTLQIDVKHCHIGHFRFDRARQAIEAIERRRGMTREQAAHEDRVLAEAEERELAEKAKAA